MPDPILADCPVHGRVHHNYRPWPNSWTCRLIDTGCRHFVPDELVTPPEATTP